MLDTNPAVAPENADTLPPERDSVGRAAPMPRTEQYYLLRGARTSGFFDVPARYADRVFPRSLRTPWPCVH